MRGLFLGIVAAALAFSQSPQGQPGALTLTGHVITGTGTDVRPVRRAKVTLTGGGLTAPLVSDTDTKGGYRFEGVPIGDHKVRIEKIGFVRLEADAAPNATLTLVRGAAIEGLVLDDSGEPLENVRVSALRLDAQRGDQPAVAVAQARTDDLGRFRLHGLAAGDYAVEAAADETQSASAFVARPGAPAVGLALDSGATARGPQGQGTRSFYPGNAAREDAKPIHLATGMEARGIDMTLPAKAPAPDSAPAADARRSGQSGAATIAGRVLAADSRKPIAGALVTITSSAEMRGWSARSDAQGRFEFAGLASGRYQINARASGHVSLSFGQRRPFDMPRPIDIRDGETFAGTDIALPRMSAIEGTVLDEFGDPAPGVIVQAAESQFVAGRYRLMPTGPRPHPSDDKGHFRLSNIPPASYYVAGLSGAFTDGNASPGFAPTYYPGTSDPAAAQPIVVDVGADMTNLVLALQPAQTAHVSGRAVDDLGQPVGRRGLLLMELNDGDLLSLVGARTSTAPDGTFQFADVPWGSYILQALAGPPNQEFGSTSIRVEGELSDVRLKVSKGAAARGRITFEGDAPHPRPEEVRIFPRPVEFITSPAVGFGPPPSHVNEDWSFEVLAMSGQRAFGAMLPRPWALKRIMRNGQDVTDTPLDFRKGDVEALEVTFASRNTTVSGTVTDDKNLPVADYAVVIFSADRGRWSFPSRFVGLARPSQSGTFRISALPPDEYLAVAVPRIDGFEWQDVALLERLRPIATSVSLQEGESKMLDLKLKRRP